VEKGKKDLKSKLSVSEMVSKKNMKSLFIVFLVFTAISIVLDFLIIGQISDRCRFRDTLCEYGFVYNIVMSDYFTYIMRIHGVIGMVISLVLIFVSILDKKWIKVGLGIIGLIIIPLFWCGLCDLFNINWEILFTPNY